MQQTTNLITEQRLLGNIIIQPEVWHEVVTNFRPELFSEPIYKTIAGIMLEISDGGNRPSSVQLYKAMRAKNLPIGPNDLIKIITGHVTIKETKALLAELEDLYKRRTVYQTLLTTLDKLQQENKETDVLIAEAQQAMLKAFEKTGSSELKSMQNVAEALFVRQEKVQSGEMLPTYPLSISGVQTLVGGFETGSLTVLAGRPSMGKTSFALNECLHWAKMGLPGIIFSLEQKDIQIGQRNLANIEEIPLNYLRGKLDQHYLDKFYTGLSTLRELPIKISDRRGLSVEQICSLARVEKMRNPNLKWIVVDYLTCLRFRGRNHTLEVGEAVSSLRNLAEEINVFVVLLAQLNRGVETRENKRPMMSDLRDSGNIEEFADTVIFLYREGYYRPDFLKAKMGDWITEVAVAKNRQGETGRTALVMFDPPHMKWENCPSDWAERYVDAVKT